MALLDFLGLGGMAQKPDPWQGMRQPQQGGGLLSQLLAPEVALPMAAALMGQQGNGQNFANAFGAAGQGLGEQRKLKAQTAERNKTLEYLRTANPELAAMVDAGMPVGEAWQTLTQQKFAQKSSLTDDMREYDMARQQGFDGSFMDYQVKMKEAGRQQVNIDTGVKLPAGFRWKNPDDQNLGVEPIPGGPGEQIPGELAARVGLADNFLRQLPAIKEQVATGSVTGPVDRALSGSGFGPGANTFRQIESGADALQRMLTGAGMPAAEAAEYARRYKPTYADDANSLLQKLDQLEQELQSAKEMAMRGRGGGQPQGVPQGGPRRTQSGVTYTVEP